MKELTVCWISAEISSFIAGWIAKDIIDQYLYIDIDDQHPDSIRFIRDIEKPLEHKIDILKSSQYNNVKEACLAFGGFRNINNGFYCCTNWLKKRVRKQWEAEHSNYHITYIWGMDVNEKDRAENLRLSMPQFNHLFPLIDYHITKKEAHEISLNLGIKRPIMYDLGYNNNNCVGCIKGGMGYWNKIRVDFPDVFNDRVQLERQLNKSILKESDGTPLFLDTLDPNRGRMSKDITPECDIFYMLNIFNQ